MPTPASAPNSRPHMPAAATTYSASRSPCSVVTPATRPSRRVTPVTLVFSTIRTPCWRAPAARALGGSLAFQQHHVGPASFGQVVGGAAAGDAASDDDDPGPNGQRVLTLHSGSVRTPVLAGQLVRGQGLPPIWLITSSREMLNRSANLMSSSVETGSGSSRSASSAASV